MKKLMTFLLAVMILTILGCSNSKVVPQAPKNDADRGHIVIDKSDMKFAVTEQPKYLKQLIPASKEGYQVVSINIIITNHSQQNIHISPDFVTIKTDKNNTYKYAPGDLDVLGKSVFREIQVPPNDEQGGGILAFEILNDEKATQVTYKDDSGHNYTVKFESPDTKI